MPVNDNGVFVPASAMGPLDAAPRRPYDPPAPSSAAAQAARKAECDRIERAARERNARQCAAESAFMRAHSAAAPRMLPPEDYKEVDPQSRSQIVSAVMAFRPQRRVCHPRDGTHLGTESEVRNQIEARERGNFLLNLGGHDPLADEVERRVVEKLKAAGVEMAPEEVDETPNREAALQADVDYQLSCLTVSPLRRLRPTGDSRSGGRGHPADRSSPRSTRSSSRYPNCPRSHAPAVVSRTSRSTSRYRLRPIA